LPSHVWVKDTIDEVMKDTLEVFNRIADKVMKNIISYARILANNQYYKEVIHQKMNQKQGSSAIYLIEEQ
jgi:hypothetical protein